MARGRHQNWICKDCKAEFQVQRQTPKFCCSCGSKNIGRAPSFELAVSFGEKKDELESVCKRLNPVFKEYEKAKAEYDSIMLYWKQQRKRGFIDQTEFDELASMFDGVKRKNDPNTAISTESSNT